MSRLTQAKDDALKALCMTSSKGLQLLDLLEQMTGNFESLAERYKRLQLEELRLRARLDHVMPGWQSHPQPKCKVHRWGPEERFIEEMTKVCFGAGRECAVCGQKQVIDHAEGRFGGPWRNVA